MLSNAQVGTPSAGFTLVMEYTASAPCPNPSEAIQPVDQRSLYLESSGILDPPRDLDATQTSNPVSLVA